MVDVIKMPSVCISRSRYTNAAYIRNIQSLNPISLSLSLSLCIPLILFQVFSKLPWIPNDGKKMKNLDGREMNVW